VGQKLAHFSTVDELFQFSLEPLNELTASHSQRGTVYKCSITASRISHLWMSFYSSTDEISEREPFYDDIAHVLQNTKKREPTSFSNLNDS